MSVNAEDDKVQLRYIQWDQAFNTVKPYELFAYSLPNLPRQNFEIKPECKETIHDIRGREEDFSLQTHGFAVRRQILELELFDEATVVNQYFPQIKKLLHDEIDDADEIFLFNWGLRSADPAKGAQEEDPANPAVPGCPVQQVHIDSSPVSARMRVQHHMGARATELLKRRFRILKFVNNLPRPFREDVPSADFPFSVWRPIKHPVFDYPLAVCDNSTLQAEKVLGVDTIRKNYFGETLYPLYVPGYKWYYLSQQTKDEVLLFQSFDSMRNAEVSGCAHTAFTASNPPRNAPPRESIEVRALVFCKN